MRRFALSLAALAAAAGSACSMDVRSAPSPRPAPADPVRYACNDGSFLSVRFRGEAAEVTMADGGRALLARRAAGSDVRYVGAGYDLLDKGDTAAWTAPGSPVTACLAT